MEDRPVDVGAISTSLDGPICVYRTNEGYVWCINLEEREVISQFQTVGNASLAISPDGSRCLGAAWGRTTPPRVGGIACYDTSDGKLVWQRRDLKLPYQPAFDERSDHWMVCSESKPCHVLDPVTGETVSKLRGVYRWYGSPFEDVAIYEGYKTRLVRSSTGEELAQFVGLKRESYGLASDMPEIYTLTRNFPPQPIKSLDCRFAPGRVFIAEMCGSLYCFNTATGDERWVHVLNEGEHYLRLGYNEDTDRLHALRFNYDTGGQRHIDTFDASSGELVISIALDGAFRVSDFEFAKHGLLLLTLALVVIDPETGERSELLDE